MFENIIEQGTVLQLGDDINNHRSAPSMLFFGPPNTGKSSAAIELSRVLSCEQYPRAEWKCSCSSCEKHRYLMHDDLLLLTNRSFLPVIAACKSALLRNPSNANSRLVFFRSLRRLILSFSPVTMEDDPKLPKISSVLQSFDEKLSEYWANSETYFNEENKLVKYYDSLFKDASSLEKEGLGSIITIGQIRRVSMWCRLSPNGRHKTLVIENAENMRDEGRNSLLKLLEEPPSSVSIVLTTKRKEAIMPTILSRLRPYRFLKRSAEGENKVIRKVFQNSVDEISVKPGRSLVSAYLDSFSERSQEKLEAAAARFIICLARIASLSAGRGAKSGNASFASCFSPGVSLFLYAAEERYAQIAGTAWLEHNMKSASVIKALLSGCDNFKDDSFSRFLEICLEIVRDVTRGINRPQFIAYNDIFGKYIGEAVTAVDVLNINTASALENLFYKLKTALTRSSYG
ncbi:MAG: DNA polymerase III [Treponema sp.]|nr:DNA polymerase III [Treponema sp.]